MSEKINPEEDGVTHINIWSKAKTELGRLLTNFAHTPFYHPRHGRFASMEGFFYWVSTGYKHDKLKDLYGFKAKEIGKSYPVIKNDKFKQELIKAARLKIIQSPRILELLQQNDLPFKHYFVYGGTHVVDRTEANQWLIGSIEQARKVSMSLI